MYDIFLSYSSQDRERLQPLVKALEHQGWSVFVDHRAIESGDLWKKKIQKAIHECKSVVAVWSKNSILIDTSTHPISYSISSEWIDEEVDIAKKRGVLLPIILDNEVEPPFGCTKYQAMDFRHWDNRNDHPEFEKLAKKIRVLLEEHERKRIVAEYVEIARQRAELEQQREMLEAQIETARQAEQTRQIELTQQIEAAQQLVASKQAELIQQTLEFEQQRADLAQQLQAAKQSGQNEQTAALAAEQLHVAELNKQLETAREQARLAAQQAAESAQRLTDEIAANQSAQARLAQQLADSQAQQAELSAQVKALDDKQQALLRQAASDQQELTRQQAELKQQQQRVEKMEQAQRTAQDQQQTAEKARQVADKNRQTAEDKLRTAEKNQQAEQARLNQQIADQQRELTTLRARPPVVTETRNPKDKFIGAIGGGLLVAAAWGVMGNYSSAPADKTLAPPIDIMPLPAGSFTMGCQSGRDSGCESDESPAHTVSLAAFELGKTEVTQGQWKAVMGSNPSSFKDCGDTCPVENVSWDEVQTFIQKLNAQTGKTYRLPSEAEWEYACRAGKDTNYCGGNDVNAVAWYGAYASPVGNSEKTTNPVGRKAANAWGLYDMSGNVYEWVQDSYHSDYKGAPSNGNAWEGSRADARVLRGGSWNINPQNVRAANRIRNVATFRVDYVGFRLARTLP